MKKTLRIHCGYNQHKLMTNMCKSMGNIAKGDGGPGGRMGVVFESIFDKAFILKIVF